MSIFRKHFSCFLHNLKTIFKYEYIERAEQGKHYFLLHKPGFPRWRRIYTKVSALCLALHSGYPTVGEYTRTITIIPFHCHIISNLDQVVVLPLTIPRRCSSCHLKSALLSCLSCALFLYINCMCIYVCMHGCMYIFECVLHTFYCCYWYFNSILCLICGLSCLTFICTIIEWH